MYPLYPQVLMYDHEHSIIIISMNIMVLHFLAAQGTAQESTFLYIPINYVYKDGVLSKDRGRAAVNAILC